MTAQAFRRQGWARFGVDERISDWLEHATHPALAAIRDPRQIGDWLRCGGTWFVGVNGLKNDASGRVNGSGPLRGAVVDFIAQHLDLGNFDWDQAQVSAVYARYPRRSAEESDAAFKFRSQRDAAHVDGLHPVGANRRRHLRECHGFLLGLPVSKVAPDAAPLVVWQGSHVIMGRMFQDALADQPPENWGEVDLTDVYHTARRLVFETCKRVELPVLPGACTLIHRHCLHGVAPWRSAQTHKPDGRVILYFRPEIHRRRWLNI